MTLQNEKSVQDVKEKISKEWNSKQVTLPLGNFALLSFYQGIFPLFIPLLCYWVYFNLWSLFPQFWYIFIIASPFLFIFTYCLYIVLLVELSRILVVFWCNKKSPQQEGEFARDFSNGDVEDPSLRYYHIRGFLYKWPTFFAKKSIFPWLVNYVLNRLGENKLHKNAVYGDCFVGLEMIEMGDGTNIQEGAILSSHVVDSIFGSITISWIKIGDHCIVHNNIGVAPGSNLRDHIMPLPYAFIKKGRNLSEITGYYLGIPASPYKFEDIEISFNRYLRLKKKE